MPSIHLLTCLPFLTLSASICHGQEAFIKEYTYQASEHDSKVTARKNAMNELKYLQLEEICTIVLAETVNITKESNDSLYTFFKNEILSVSGGEVAVKVTDERWDGHSYYIKAEVRVDKESIRQRTDEIYNHLIANRNQEKEQADIGRQNLGAIRKGEVTLFYMQSLSEYLDKSENASTSFQYYYAESYLDTARAFYDALSESLPGAIKATGGQNEWEFKFNYRYARIYHDWGMRQKEESKKKYATGKFKLAVQHLKKALVTSPTHYTCYYLLGSSYKELNEYKQSVIYYKQALKYTKDQCPVVDELICLYSSNSKTFGQGCLSCLLAYKEQIECGSEGFYECIKWRKYHKIKNIFRTTNCEPCLN